MFVGMSARFLSSHRDDGVIISTVEIVWNTPFPGNAKWFINSMSLDSLTDGFNVTESHRMKYNGETFHYINITGLIVNGTNITCSLGNISESYFLQGI